MLHSQQERQTNTAKQVAPPNKKNLSTVLHVVCLWVKSWELASVCGRAIASSYCEKFENRISWGKKEICVKMRTDSEECGLWESCRDAHHVSSEGWEWYGGRLNELGRVSLWPNKRTKWVISRYTGAPHAWNGPGGCSSHCPQSSLAVDDISRSNKEWDITIALHPLWWGSQQIIRVRVMAWGVSCKGVLYYRRVSMR